MKKIQVMRCPNCKANIGLDDKKCPYCQAKISFEHTKFCQWCGERIAGDCIVCPQCQKQTASIEVKVGDNKNKQATVFCEQCGKKIHSRAVQCKWCKAQLIYPLPANLEFERICARCGNTWYSLVDRELKIAKDTKLVYTCYGSLTNQYEAKTATETLTHLRQCSNCHSTNYSEEIIF